MRCLDRDSVFLDDIEDIDHIVECEERFSSFVCPYMSHELCDVGEVSLRVRRVFCAIMIS